jgi:hypothetical protein
MGSTRATGLFPYAVTASNYTNYLTDSTDGSATFTLLINGLSALAISSLGGTGYITDNDTATANVNDTCANQITVTDGSVTWSTVAVLLTTPPGA